MNSNESAINAILKGVTYLIDKAIQKAPFDRMVSGVVILKRINTVDIIIDGVTYTNIPIITHSVDYPIGDYPIDVNATQQNVNTTGAPAFQNHEEQKC
jgi:hypothetical protein